MNRGEQPEFRFAIRMGHMHVDARFLSGEEEKAKLTFTKYGWCHAFTLTHMVDFAGTPVSSGKGPESDADAVNRQSQPKTLAQFQRRLNIEGIAIQPGLPSVLLLAAMRQGKHP